MIIRSPYGQDSDFAGDLEARKGMRHAMATRQGLSKRTRHISVKLLCVQDSIVLDCEAFAHC